MLERKDIEQAKNLFEEWDLNRVWHSSTPEFIEHCRKKAKDSLNLANYLLDKFEQTRELEDNDSVTIWVITLNYYSMFFEVEYLLGLEGRKLPEGSKDTHKTIYLAFLYYYVVKGSELEQKNYIGITSSRMSKALTLFKALQDETLELQRVQKSVKDLKSQREERQALTYKMSRTAEICEAKKSFEKAAEFRQLIEEYILSLRR